MLEWMSELLDGFLDGLVSVLPLSPFTEIIDKLEGFPHLGVINWFLPIGEFIAIGGVWLTAIATYYVYSVIARWLKLIT